MIYTFWYSYSVTIQYKFPYYGFEVVANFLEGSYSCANWYEYSMEVQLYIGT